MSKSRLEYSFVLTNIQLSCSQNDVVGYFKIFFAPDGRVLYASLYTMFKWGCNFPLLTRSRLMGDFGTLGGNRLGANDREQWTLPWKSAATKRPKSQQNAYDISFLFNSYTWLRNYQRILKMKLCYAMTLSDWNRHMAICCVDNNWKVSSTVYLAIDRSIKLRPIAYWPITTQRRSDK